MDETIILQQGTEAKILAYQWGRHNDIVSLVLLVINGDTAVELCHLLLLKSGRA